MTNEEYRAYEGVADKYLETVDKTIYDIEGNPLNIGFKIWKTYIDGFIDGRKDIAQQEIHNVKINYNQLFDEYKKLEKENAELTKQIEKMKRCVNCKHSLTMSDTKSPCNYCDTKFNKWELKEK